MHDFLHNSDTTPMCGTHDNFNSNVIFCFHSRKGNYNVVFCVMTQPSGQNMEAADPSVLWHHLQDRSSEHNMEAADPSVFWYNLQDRTWGSRFFWNAG